MGSLRTYGVTRDPFDVQRYDSYLLNEGPGVRNSNSAMTAFSSNIKIATRHELMKRPVKTHNLRCLDWMSYHADGESLD
jgi:hypothetical protein